MKRNFKKNKGITLIALIITIIILLILVGVSINLAIKGDLFGSTRKAVKGTNAKVEEEQTRVDELMNELDTIEQETGNNTIENPNPGGDTTDKKMYTVRFCNNYGTLLQEVNVEEGGTAKYSLEKPTKELPPLPEPGGPYIFYWWATEKSGSEKADLTNITSNMEVYAYYMDHHRVGFNSTTITTNDGEEIVINDPEYLSFPDYTSYAQRAFEEALDTNQSLTDFFNSSENIDSFNILYCTAFKINIDNALQTNTTFTITFPADKNFKVFQCMDVENIEDRWVELNDDKCVRGSTRKY